MCAHWRANASTRHKSLGMARPDDITLLKIWEGTPSDPLHRACLDLHSVECANDWEGSLDRKRRSTVTFTYQTETYSVVPEYKIELCCMNGASEGNNSDGRD